jgi:galactose-1-phosphate uridylyltransferase
MLDYLSTEAGRQHVAALVERRTSEPWAHMSETDRAAHVEDFFGGGHDVIVARRHFADGATDTSELASSGTLTPDEHDAYLRFTIDALRDLYASNRYVRYVAVFQNWLRPAGASFDHLHKQLVAIDERGVQAELEIQRARANPNGYNEFAVDYAAYHNLTVAENEHAVAFAGFGHRYPTLEIFSRSERPQPWLHSAAELRGMSDLIHALHAASGAATPCNEEWHHKPPDADVPTPWRVLIKWRLSTVAGFEGGTKIYLNTIDPPTLRDMVTGELFRLRAAGAIAGSLRIGPECACVPNSLRYNPAVRRTARPDAAFPPLYGPAADLR